MNTLAHDLFMLLSSLIPLKNRDRMMTLFVEAINHNDSGFSIAFQEDPPVPGVVGLGIKADGRDLGYFILDGDPERVAPEFPQLLQNAVQMLAVLLEKHYQGELLQDEQSRLRSLVDEQTASLRASEEDLHHHRDALTASQQQYQSVVEDLSALVCRNKPDGTIEFVNDAYCKYFGKTQAEMIGRDFFDLIPQEDREQVRTSLTNLNAENPLLVHVHRVIDRHGRIRYQRWTNRAILNPQGEVLSLQAYGEDITEQIRIQEALEESDRAMSTLLENLPGIAYRCLNEPHWPFEFVSQGALALTGFTPDEFMNQSVYFGDLIHMDDRESLWEQVQTALENKQPFELEYRIRTKDSHEKWVWERGSGVWDQKGQFVALEGFVADVTERKRADRALFESEKKYRELVELAQEGIWVINKENETAFVNPSMAKMLGYTPEEMLGKHLFAFMDKEGVALAQANLERRQQGVKEQHDFEFIGKDGQRVHTAIETAPIVDEAGNYDGAIAGVIDITERKRTMESLRRIEWLLNPETKCRPSYTSPYGDLTELNSSRIILDSVGESLLAEIAEDYLALLGTSGAIYEANGDYALGIFSSGWCQFLDNASREICATDSNSEALASGNWHCHESCWTEASQKAIATGQPVDIECNGGIHLYTVPIRAGGEIVGAMNVGWGDPPSDESELKRIAEKYKVSLDELRAKAWTYESRPPFLIETAKRRLETAATLIGEIVHRRQTEQSLRESEQRHRALFEQNADALVVIDPETGHILDFNEQACQNLGYTHEEFRHITLADVEVIEAPAEVADHISKIRREGGDTFETKHRTKDGEIRDVLVITRVISVGGKDLIQSVWHDITEQKQVKATLMERERLLNQVEEIAEIGGWEMDLEKGGVATWTRGTYDIVEIAPEEPVPGYDEHLNWYLPEFRDMIRQKMKALLEAREPMQFEAMLKTRTGKLKWCQAVGEVVERDGQVVKLRGTFQDITERRHAERAIEETQQRLELIYESTSDVMALIGVFGHEDYRFVSVNNAYWNAVHAINPEVLKEEIIGANVYRLVEWFKIPRPVLDQAVEQYRKAMATHSVVHLVETIHTPLGELFMDSFYTPIFDSQDSCTHILYVARDVTARTKAERALLDQQRTEKERIQAELDQVREELVRKTRLAAIGQVSGSIAHDLRNPLGAARNASYLLRRRSTDADRRITETIDIIDKEIIRADQIIKNMLSIARSWEPLKEPVDLVPFLAQLCQEMMSPTTIEYSLSTEPKPFIVPIDTAQMRQVVVNILNNAQDAMPNGGNLDVRLWQNESWAQLEFHDSGTGLNDAVRNRLFEPLVTTKTKGTGLGLTICKQIIEAHVGTIKVSGSDLGGTAVLIQLPAPKGGGS